MRRTKLLWRLYFSYLPITILAVAAVAWYSSSALRKNYEEQVLEALRSEASILREIFTPLLAANREGKIDELSKQYGRLMDVRITVISPLGKVIGDSNHDPATMADHSDRPEVKRALEKVTSGAKHFSLTLRENFFYLAMPAVDADKVIGIIRTSIPAKSMAATLDAMYRKIFVAGLIIAAAIAVFSLAISKWISLPIEQMKAGAKRFADGDLKYRLSVSHAEETGSLAESLNRMAEQLDERINAITLHKNELEAILKSMTEALIVVDEAEKILRINRAAGELFAADPAYAEGKSIEAAIRNSQLQNFVKKILSGSPTGEGEIVALEPEERYLQATGSRLADSSGKIFGAVIALNDVTRLKKLETMRKDFVANVSHELKTPITSIKGFVETLKDGAIDDRESARKFLDIISTHSERLNAIIEDLMNLSRIEQQEGQGKLPVDDSRIVELLKSASSACDVKSREKGIKVVTRCPDNLTARINAPFLEHALVNLLDNAIKYSDSDKTVAIEALRENGSLVIRVSDEGWGIPKEHLERIFERFYRVDKARSRKLGGTGLGLAIAKHIVQAHKGEITVESTPGKGSSFTITLPVLDIS